MSFAEVFNLPQQLEEPYDECNTIPPLPLFHDISWYFFGKYTLCFQISQKKSYCPKVAFMPSIL